MESGLTLSRFSLVKKRFGRIGLCPNAVSLETPSEHSVGKSAPPGTPPAHPALTNAPRRQTLPALPPYREERLTLSRCPKCRACSARTTASRIRPARGPVPPPPALDLLGARTTASRTGPARGPAPLPPALELLTAHTTASCTGPAWGPHHRLSR
ncbi:unnamed protein product [Rangifer tarandus platyrhynchus]|uniref:Uncharacterized protein n=1 Tax=Rangifer tarandus platyrhynchus TaxID=3082113 RepID=A0ABN8Y7K9_RANTA|nr:unnamed protein product [Rangifer tarandus platyrhynchus]